MSKNWLKMQKYARETDTRTFAQQDKQEDVVKVKTKNTIWEIINKTYHQEINNGPISYVFWLGILGWGFLSTGNWEYLAPDIPKGFELALVLIFYSFQWG